VRDPRTVVRQARAQWRRLSGVPAEVEAQAATLDAQADGVALLATAHHDTRLVADHAVMVAADALAEARQLRPWIGDLDARTTGEAEKAAVVHDHELRLQRLERQLAIVAFMRYLAHTPVAEDLVVSVILPTFDRAHLLSDAIDSVLAQSYPRWELLVVDDGSTDATAELLDRYDDPRLRRFRTDHVGASGARNRALDEVRGDVVAYLDSDNRMDRDWCKAVVWAFTTNPDEHALYGARVIDHPERVYGPEVGPFPAVQFEPFDRAALEVGNFADMGVLAHRAGLDVRFDEELIWYGDWDLLLQLTADRAPIELPALACCYAAGPADRLTPVAGEDLPPAVEVDRRRVRARHGAGDR
jgi:hypothetical protein